MLNDVCVAKDLVSRLLEKDPAKRITTKQLLQHPWLKVQYNELLSKSFMKIFYILNVVTFFRDGASQNLSMI
jgi:serine/threonine protein kinase